MVISEEFRSLPEEAPTATKLDINKKSNYNGLKHIKYLKNSGGHMILKNKQTAPKLPKTLVGNTERYQKPNF